MKYLHALFQIILYKSKILHRNTLIDRQTDEKTYFNKKNSEIIDERDYFVRREIL